MVGHLRRHAIAYVALFAALGGGTVYAAGARIGSKQIKPNAVKARQIAPNAVGDSEANEADFGVIRSGRVGINDSGAAPPTEKVIFTRGPFTIRGACQDNTSIWGTGASISSSQPAFAVGLGETTDPDDVGSTPVPIAPTSLSFAATGGATTRAVTAYTPGGRYISVSIFEVRRPDPGTDCAFYVNGQGR